MKPEASRAELEAELARILDSPVRLEAVSQGEESLAFALAAAGRELILRLHPSGDGYAKDAFVARKFAAADLPIPAIARRGVLDGGLHYCLSERAPGRTLQDLEGPALDAVLAPVVACLSAIARADTDSIAGYGPFDASGRGAFDSWNAYLRAVAEPAIYDWRRGCTGSVLDRVLVLVEHVDMLAAVCPERHQLVHADFGSNNVLAANGAVTGVIDWSEAMAGDPLYDLANIFFWRSWLTCMERQAQLIEATRPELCRCTDRLACYQLRIGLEVAHDALRREDADMVSWALQRCEEIAAASRR